MIAGQREETLISRTARHIKEAEESIQGWKFELDYAKRKNDAKHETICTAMIRIYENTLTELCKEYELFSGNEGAFSNDKQQQYRSQCEEK